MAILLDERSTCRAGSSTMRGPTIRVTRDPAAMGEPIASVVAPQWLPFD